MTEIQLQEGEGGYDLDEKVVVLGHFRNGIGASGVGLGAGEHEQHHGASD
jgi:hypothetical protein